MALKLINRQLNAGTYRVGNLDIHTRCNLTLQSSWLCYIDRGAP